MWNKIGLKENIFFTHPLNIDKKDSKLLIGRRDDIENVKRQIDMDNKLIQIVTGRFGIGKTSFLNVFQYLVYSRKDGKILLPAYRKIRIGNETSYNEFIIEILLSLCENIREYYIQSRKKIPDEIKFLVEYWLGLKSGNHSTGREFEIDIQIFKFKTNNNSSDTFWNNSDPFFSLKELIELFLKKSKLDGIFFHVDNLELIEIQKLIKLLDDSRDTIFSINNVYWLLSSSNQLLPFEIYNRSPRFSGIISGHSINLDFLTLNQLYEAIELRIEESKINENDFIVVPFDKEVVQKVYNFTNYDLRETFKILQYLFSYYFSYTQYCKDLLDNQNQIDFFTAKDVFIEYCLKYSELIKISEEDKSILKKIFLEINKTYNVLFKIDKTPYEKIESLINIGLIKKDENEILKPTFRLKTIGISGMLGDEIKDKILVELIGV